MSNTDAIQIPVVHYPCGCGLDHHAASGSPYAPQPPLSEERIRQIVREELAALVTNAPQPEYFVGKSDKPLISVSATREEWMQVLVYLMLDSSFKFFGVTDSIEAAIGVSPAAGADDGAGMSAERTRSSSQNR